MKPPSSVFLARLFAALCLALAVVATHPAQAAADRIDREALVKRHNPTLDAVDPWAPFTVGNGRFAFTADVTGLQTFSEHYQKNGIPLETQARWAWHSNPNPQSFKLSDANKDFTAYGKTIGYPTNQSSPAGRWLRENPHDWPLGQLGFVDAEGQALFDVSNIEQTLDLWSGELRSRFTWRGDVVEVTTLVDPQADLLVVNIQSPAVARGRLRVRLAFPRGHDIATKNNPALDWSEPKSHRTIAKAWKKREGGAPLAMSVLLQRERDDAHYQASLEVEGATIEQGTSEHEFVIVGREATGVRIALRYAADKIEPSHASRDFADVQRETAKYWRSFWLSGAAIDFSGSKDPRAQELERRVVLSQYLTAVQFGGDFPPQETGLTHSSWYGKHHTEMIWWHTAHFALWGRQSFLEKNLAWYVSSLPTAQALAQSRGLAGARWAKMIGPDGRESPGGNPLIIWNQPHPIHLAELIYRNSPTPETLARYEQIVMQTAECMASMLNWDEAKQRYNLGPPMWIAQEIYDQGTSMNPTYELSYWIRGLTIAQQWRERLKLGRNAEWDRRIAKIAKLPVKDGKYVAIETTPDTWDNKDSRHDHPSFLMALGQLPGDGVDVSTMRRTLNAVLTSWDWETKIWGWDYPMVAMTAARLGEPQKAVDILLFTKGPNNAYKANGHCPQHGDLPVYLPANGSLLAAVAMMAGGWDDAPTKDAPGFPKDGSWVVRSEGLKPLP